VRGKKKRRGWGLINTRVGGGGGHFGVNLKKGYNSRVAHKAYQVGRENLSTGHAGQGGGISKNEHLWTNARKDRVFKR